MNNIGCVMGLYQANGPLYDPFIAVEQQTCALHIKDTY